MTVEQRKQIELLYLEMFEKLMIFARCNLDSEALAEEAVQDAFRIACQNPEKLCGSENPRGWLVNVLKNTIANMYKSRASAKRIVERYLLCQLREMSFSEDAVKLNILYENVADMEEFKLLSEMAIEGRSHAEMAKARNISVSACKKRVQRAKEILREKIEN